jgi:hypothetical protein
MSCWKSSGWMLISEFSSIRVSEYKLAGRLVKIEFSLDFLCWCRCQRFDLRGECSSRMKLGNWFLFLMMTMLEKLQNTEICYRLRSVLWLLFWNATKSWSLIDERLLMCQQSLSCGTHDEPCLLTRIDWMCIIVSHGNTVKSWACAWLNDELR